MHIHQRYLCNVNRATKSVGGVPRTRFSNIAQRLDSRADVGGFTETFSTRTEVPHSMHNTRGDQRVPVTFHVWQKTPPIARLDPSEAVKKQPPRSRSFVGREGRSARRSSLLFSERDNKRAAQRNTHRHRRPFLSFVDPPDGQTDDAVGQSSIHPLRWPPQEMERKKERWNFSSERGKRNEGRGEDGF